MQEEIMNYELKIQDGRMECWNNGRQTHNHHISQPKLTA
jgi:hypothetical protein